MSRIVIALGGNALGNTPSEQLELIEKTASPLADLVQAGHDLIIAHGNGPQVGMINLAMSAAAESGAIKSSMPFPECGAMSQGYIGYHLQNGLENELRRRAISKPVVTLITQVVVDSEDPAFNDPTKPIGAFYTEQQAKQIAAEKGYIMKEDAGRGYRRVVPSPRPVDVVEKASIQALIASGHIVITVGGGGIPVVRKNGALRGVAAVIDKDFASAKLAELVNADELIILTAVPRVAINFGKPDQKELDRLSVAQAREYCAQGQFAKGSMLPKVQAAISFAEKGGWAVIAALEDAGQAADGRCGTVIEQ